MNFDYGWADCFCDLTKIREINIRGRHTFYTGSKLWLPNQIVE